MNEHTISEVSTTTVVVPFSHMTMVFEGSLAVALVDEPPVSAVPAVDGAPAAPMPLGPQLSQQTPESV